MNAYQLHQEWLRRQHLKVVASAAAEPISVDEAAQHLRIDQYGSPPAYDEQAWLEAAITAAREVCEMISGRAIASTQYELAMPQFPGQCGYSTPMIPWAAGAGICLQVAPVTSVDAVTYVDTTGAAQTVTDFVLDDYAEPCVLHPAYGATWPSARESVNAVRVRFTAGYQPTGASPTEPQLPRSVRQAILLVLGHLYENREQVSDLRLAEIPMGVQALLERYRLRMSMA